MRSLSMRLLACVAAAALAPPAVSHAQSGRPSAGDVTLEATEVTLDVVARDRRGRAVTDLTAADLVVLEDGRPQEVTSFRLVRPSDAPDAVASPAGPPSAAGPRAAPEVRSLTTAPEDIKATAIVFDSLTPDARAIAYKAAKRYVEENFRAGDAAGVFLVDLSLVALQPYTTDKSAVLAGVEAAGERAGTTFTSMRNRILKLGGAAGGVPQTDVEVDIPLAGSPDAPHSGDSTLRQMRIRTAVGFERLQNLQRGYATTNALLAVIEGLSLLPGRKSLLFFSQGVAIPSEVERQFQAVISSANLARVSIYTVDAAGLRVDSPSAEVGRALNAYAAARNAEIGTPSEGRSGPMLRAFEGVETLMRSNPEASLGRLAKETGGVFVSGTNVPGARLRQIDEDMRTYYVLTYAPQNTNYDGSFRRVSVAVRRRGVRVSTREGYYAINVPNAPPVLPYEAPAVAAATARTTRSDFSIGALAASFPEADRPGLAPVLVSAPASAATFVEDAKTKTFTTAFSVVVLARDQTGRIVAKASKEYILTGPLDRLEATRRGDLLYYTELDLEPGRYTVDVAAYDAPTRRVSVRRVPLVVVPAGDGPRLSSVTIVERAEEIAPSDPAAGEPFRVGRALLYPNLGTPLKKAADGNLAFFVTAYVAAGRTSAPEASVEVAQNGRSLVRLPVELPAPDARGRIQYANAFPIAPFPPGTYELRVTVSDGVRSATRSARFTIAG